MPLTLDSPDAVRLDALKEIGSIGAGNAMTALASFVNRDVDMSTPRAGILSLAAFAETTGGPEALAVGVYLPVTGDAPGHAAFLLPAAGACRLADSLLGREAGQTQELGELERSALLEVGNILTASYSAALCEMTGLNLFAAPPALAVDMTGAILSAIACAFDSANAHALTITTRIGAGADAVEGYFLFVPEPGSLTILLAALGMGEAL